MYRPGAGKVLVFLLRPHLRKSKIGGGRGGGGGTAAANPKESQTGIQFANLSNPPAASGKDDTMVVTISQVSED
jgi:hypothetical protein